MSRKTGNYYRSTYSFSRSWSWNPGRGLGRAHRTKRVNRSLYEVEPTGVDNLGVLKVLFVILLLSALFSSLSGSPTSFTFSGLLEKLSTCPSLYGDWMTTLTDARIYNDWGVFNFFRDFLNMFMSILSVGVYMCTGIVQLLLYAIFMLSVVFGG